MVCELQCDTSVKVTKDLTSPLDASGFYRPPPPHEQSSVQAICSLGLSLSNVPMTAKDERFA